MTRIQTRTQVAEEAAASGWLRRLVSTTVSRCRAAGLDEAAYAAVPAIGEALDDGFAPGRERRARAWRSDREYVAALVTIEQQLLIKQGLLQWLADRWYDEYHTAEFEARTALDTATRAYWHRVMQSTSEAHGIAEEALERIWQALCAARSAYEQLEDVYQDAYDLVRAGRVLPYNGRWITGDGAALAPLVRRIIQKVR